MSRLLMIMVVLVSSLFASEVYLYKYNKDGTPYSKTVKSTGEVHIYTNRFIALKNIEITAKLIEKIREVDINENLYARAFSFCSSWDDVVSKDTICKEFAYKVVGKELSPNKKYTIDIGYIKTGDYRWISQEKFLELKK